MDNCRILWQNDKTSTAPLRGHAAKLAHKEMEIIRREWIYDGQGWKPPHTVYEYEMKAQAEMEVAEEEAWEEKEYRELPFYKKLFRRNSNG